MASKEALVFGVDVACLAIDSGNGRAQQKQHHRSQQVQTIARAF